jgi:hypothetical protein
MPGIDLLLVSFLLSPLLSVFLLFLLVVLFILINFLTKNPLTGGLLILLGAIYIILSVRYFHLSDLFTIVPIYAFLMIGTMQVLYGLFILRRFFRKGKQRVK